jgi:hypothetical protein
VISHVVSGQEIIVEAGGDTVYAKYSLENFLTPIWGIDIYHYDFDRFGVRYPTNAKFTSFSESSRNSGLFFYAGLNYDRLMFFGYADMSGLLSPPDTEKNEWKEAILNEKDSLDATKASLNQHSYGLELAYPIAILKQLEIIPVLGLHHWTFISKFEVADINSGKVVNYYSEQKNLTNATLELTLFFVQLSEKKKKISSQNPGIFAFYKDASHYQSGIYIEPSYKKFIGNNLHLVNLELGIGQFVERKYHTFTALGFYFNIGVCQGDVKSKIYRLGLKMR